MSLKLRSGPRRRRVAPATRGLLHPSERGRLAGDRRPRRRRRDGRPDHRREHTRPPEPSPGSAAPHTSTTSSAPATTQPPRTHARIVTDAATFRRLEIAGTRVAQIARTGETHPAEAHNLAAAEIAAAYRPGTEGKKTHIGDLIGAVLDDLENTDTVQGLSWPWIDANRILNPMAPGDLIVGGGGPGMGKSVWINELARHVAVTLGKTAVIHSLEIGENEIIKRIIAAEASVNLSDLTAKTLTDAQWGRIAAATKRLADSPLHIVDTPTVSLREIRASIAQHDPAIVLMDYIPLGAVNPKMDRRQALEELSRGLKLLAKEAGIPIVAAAQLGRSVEQRPDHILMLSDLRETGSLERDADIVILLNRPDYYDKESPRTGELDQIVAKQRNAGTGTFTNVHQLHYSRFVDMAA